MKYLKTGLLKNKKNTSLVKCDKNEICHIYTIYCIIYIDGALF